MYFSGFMNYGSLNESLIYIVLLVLNFILVLIAALAFNPTLIALALIFLLLSFFIIRFWDYINALIINHSNFIELFGGYELDLASSIAVSSSNGIYNAVSLGYFKFDGSDEFDRDKIESIIRSNPVPFRFVINIEKVNQKKILGDLRTKKHIKEIELANLSREKDFAKSSIIRRKIDVISQDIADISSGTSFKLVYYLIAYGSSENKFRAETMARENLEKISASFSSAFKCTMENLHGSDLVSFLKFESMISHDL